VLEIGVGSGLNLALYAADVDHVYALDPSAELLGMARRSPAQAAVPASFVRASAEQPPFTDAVFDTVVVTWTLCSVRDPISALTEMRRVLKPGGLVLFVEHGLSPEPGVARWQRRLTPCWSRVGSGCHLDRNAYEFIRAAGFEIRGLETGYMRGPKPWTYMYQGAGQEPGT
jgi:ubiquinone/menaquinone biosynthesis C-methylase UbiE